MDNNKWHNVEVVIGNQVIKNITSVSYKEKKSEITQNITFSNKNELVSAIKKLGFELHYGVDKNKPVSYSNNTDFTIHCLSDFESFIKTISLSEWNKA